MTNNVWRTAEHTKIRDKLRREKGHELGNFRQDKTAGFHYAQCLLCDRKITTYFSKDRSGLQATGDVQVFHCTPLVDLPPNKLVVLDQITARHKALINKRKP